MTDEPKSFWWRFWGRPVRFFAWTALASLLASIVSSVILDHVHRGPNWSDLRALTIIVGFSAIFVVSALGLILAAIPLTRPLMMWALRRWFFFTAVFATLIALFFAEENWRGKRAWEQAKQELAAQGIDLNWDHYIPPAVPDDQNIFKAPKMSEWFVRGRPESTTSYWAKSVTNQATVSVGSNSNAITSEAAAREYLSWSDQFEPDFDVIREGLKRPYAWIEGDHSMPFSSQIPNFIALREVARMLAQRAHCYFLLHEPDKALAELTLVRDMCRMCEAAPTGRPMFLISAMINVAITGLWANEIGDGFRLHAWQEPQLKVLQQQLGETQLFPFLVNAFQTEPAASCQTIENEPPEKLLPYFNTAKSLFAVAPRGWVYQNLANVVKFSPLRGASFNLTNNSVSPQITKEAQRKFEKFIQHRSPFRVLAAIVVPNTSKASETVARNQNLVNQALVACALERYHIAHNEYPETFGALVPQFVEKLPNDVINGGELKYRRTNDGFVLYSIGWNEKDDGGSTSFDKPGNLNGQALDWVWPYSVK